MSVRPGEWRTARGPGKTLEEKTAEIAASSPSLLQIPMSRRVASFAGHQPLPRSSSPYFPLNSAFSQPSLLHFSHIRAFSHISPVPVLPTLSPLRPLPTRFPAKSLKKPSLRAMTSRQASPAYLSGSVSTAKLGKRAQRHSQGWEKPFDRILRCEGHRGAVTDFTSFPLVTVSADYSLAFWALPDLTPSPYHTIYPYSDSIQPLHTVRRAHKGPIWTVENAQNGQIVTAGGDCRVKIWAGTDLIRIMRSAVAIRALVVSNGAIIGAGGEGMVGMWDIETGKCIFQHRYGHHRMIRCLIPIGSGTYASGSEDCSVSIWDPRAIYPVALLSGHTDTVLSLCLGRQNSLISGSEDGTIAIWDVRAGKRLEKGVIGERVNDVELWNGQVLCAGQGLSVYEAGKMRKIQLEEGEILKVKALPTDLIYTASRSCRLSIWSPRLP